MKIYGLEKISDAKQKKEYEQMLTSPLVNQTLGTTEFSIVPNPSGVHPQFDIFPLAEKLTNQTHQITAVLTDMDGTTTTTEALCLHSLEYMVQQITKTPTDTPIKLDPDKDYPHIIGNSTTKHVEYLLRMYGSHVDEKRFIKSFINAVLWTLNTGKDEKRKKEAKQVIQLLRVEKNINELLGSLATETLLEIEKDADGMLEGFAGSLSDPQVRIRMAIEVYYQRYHEILMKIATGHAEEIAKSLLDGKNPIEPMPGVGVFLALCKGFIGEELPTLFPDAPESNIEKLRILGKHMQQHPVKIALVTSSIFYEANIVLTEVFRILQEDVENWPLPKEKKVQVKEAFADYTTFYDAVITASDSHEIRLKPHRDLYSIALYTIGIPPQEFSTVFGFEDSESGLLAIRAAGVGRAIGVPFDATKGHNLDAAAVVMKNGLPEFLIDHSFFLDP